MIVLSSLPFSAGPGQGQSPRGVIREVIAPPLPGGECRPLARAGLEDRPAALLAALHEDDDQPEDQENDPSGEGEKVKG